MPVEIHFDEVIGSRGGFWLKRVIAVCRFSTNPMLEYLIGFFE